jgi:Ankyrin repeat
MFANGFASFTLQAVRLLIAKGGCAAVHVREQQHGHSPLHSALGQQQTAELVRLLINSGADVNAETNGKVTSLMLAQELSVVRLLLEAGAAVNAKSVDGSTALHKAAELGLSAGVICCLLKAGADATAANSEGHNAAAVAVKRGHTATAALLQRAAVAAPATTAAANTAAAATVAEAVAATTTAPTTAAAVPAVATAAASTVANTDSTTTAAAASGSCATSADAAADTVTHAKHTAEVVKASTVHADAATTTTTTAAAEAAAAEASTWMCIHCKHMYNRMQDVTCQACGVVGNTEQDRQEFEAELPHFIAKCPHVTLPASFCDRMPAKTTAKTTAKTKPAAAAPRSARTGSSSDNLCDRTLIVSCSSASVRSSMKALSSMPGVEAVYSFSAPAPAPAAAAAAASTSTPAAPARSKRVGGSWRCAERDLPVRNGYLSRIAQLLASSAKTRLCSSTRDNSSVPTAARYLETELYNSAASFAVYSDDSTWQLRLSEIVESDMSCEAAAAWRAADPYYQQREQEAVAAIAAGTIAPTPLAGMSTELAGDNWRSDAHDMQQRSKFVNTIAQAFEKTPRTVVLELARRLEASLYSSACSFQSYSDQSTWVSRLQQAMIIEEKRTLASGATSYAAARVVPAASAASRSASSNGAKPIPVRAAASTAAAAAVATVTVAAGANTGCLPCDATAATTVASAVTTASERADDNTLTCATAVVDSSAPVAVSTAVVAVKLDTATKELVANAEATEAVSQQPHSSEQQQCAMNAKQLVSGKPAQALSAAAVNTNDIAISAALTAAEKRYDSTACVSSSSSLINVGEVTSELAAATLKYQQQQRLLDAERRVKASAQTVAATAAAAAAAFSHAMAQQILYDTHAVLAATVAAVSSADSASVALKAQVAALQALHAAQLETEQQCMNRAVEHVVAADCIGVVTESVESDSDDDCPSLAYASDMYTSNTNVHSDITAVAAPAATVTDAVDSSTSSSSSRAGDAATQKQSLQQQPCVQCGKMTKKRCRRCQAVYYCSEQCQMLCFKDPEHRAQCDAAAAMLML